MTSPAIALNFTLASLDQRITFTRSAATATRVNANGFIETTAADAPRFDFNPVTLVCKGLSIESLRTNLVLQSSDFAATWLADGATVSSNSVISPDGTQNADEINSVAANWRMAQGFGVTGSTAYTCSAFVKKGNSTTVKLEFASTGGANPSVTANIFYNFDTNTVTGGGSVTSPTVTPYSNGWFRISGVLTTSASHTTMLIYCYGGAEYGLAGKTNWWGVQVEAGTFPTSYIPTTSAAVTRNADVATITGTAFSGFWRSGPGSILVRALPSTVSGTRPLVQVDDATADNIIALRGNATNPELYIRAGGSDQATIDAGTISAAAYRLAGAWQAGSAAASLNSGLAVNGAPASIPAVTQMRLCSDGTNYLNGHLQAVEYWPVRLSNAGLQTASSTAGYQSIIHPVLQDTII